MDCISSKARTCCIIGRRNLIKGYEPAIERELEALLVGGINHFLFCGLGPFERACLRALHTLRTRYFFTSRFKTVLFSDDPALIEQWRLSFDQVYRLFPPQNFSGIGLFFCKRPEYGGAYSVVRLGLDGGLCPINSAFRKKQNDNS